MNRLRLLEPAAVSRVPHACGDEPYIPLPTTFLNGVFPTHVGMNRGFNVLSAQLWQAVKLATMGELAASIAHELNNSLATVTLRIESLLAQAAADTPQWRTLTVVEQEVERMGQL